MLREVLRPAARASLDRFGLPGAILAGADSLPPTRLALSRATDGTLLLGIFVRLTDPSGLAAITEAGGEIGSRVGDIVTARVPVDAVPALAAAPGIAYVEGARALVAEHDTSMVVIGVTDLRTLAGDHWEGATGEGTLVAIYDSGLDLDHQDFRDAAGRSRVVSVWDQTTAGNPPPGYSTGFVCDSTAIAMRVETGASTCPMRDFNGHGTHVAGTAAGDGSATGNGLPAFRYAGVAPNAKLIIVKGGNGSFFENLIIDGLVWIRDEAERLGRPVVVNLSLGGQFGPHDGTRIYEQAIDDLSGPGFIVTISAGNQGVNQNTDIPVGGRLIHARGFATGTATRTFTMILPTHTPNVDTCNGNVTQLGFWYDGSDRLRIDVVRPSGSIASAPFGQAVSLEAPDGRVAIDNGSGGVDFRNGDYGVGIRIDGCGAAGAPAAGTWEIRVTPETPGSGLPYDMWIEITQHGNGAPFVQMYGGDGFDNRFIVGSPGNATRALTVGAFATRMCWPSQTGSGTTCYTQKEEIGDLARFSNGGPRRDGVGKPDIAAPGIGIMSARSSSASVNLALAEPDNVHSVLAGTSMASPHVAGTVALLFEAKPDLTPEEARDLIAVSAVQDEFTQRIYDPAGVPTDWWGAGKLNARDALAALTGDGPAILALATAVATPDASVRAPRGTRLPLLSIQLSAQGAEAIDVRSLSFEVTGTDPGAYLVLVRDTNGNGELDGADTAVDSAAVALTGEEEAVTVDVSAGALRVPALGHVTVFAALSLSGESPNGTVFSLTFEPQATVGRGVNTGLRTALNVADTPLTSGPARTTVLAIGEILSFSANPVRGEEVIFNFTEPPEVAAVYTVTGRRVIDLRVDDGVRARWDLRNEDGTRVAPGVYLVVFRIEDQLFREKLVILTPGEQSP